MRAVESPLILKRASASRPSGEWNDDDFDVLADGAVVGRIFKGHASPRLRRAREPHADAWLRSDARGRDGGVREELAAGLIKRHLDGKLVDLDLYQAGDRS
jgi:hypothetical protein